VYYKTTRPYTEQGGDYRIVTPGVGVRFGVPFTERDTVFFGLGAERIRIDEGNQLPVAYRDQDGTYFPATIGWTRDGRDSALVPNEGRLQRFNTELGLSSDKRYVKLNYQIQQYIPLSRKYTLAFNGEIGVGRGINGDFPVLKNFYGGGLGSVRGFDQGTLWPRDEVIGSTTGETVNVGGAKNFVLNTEFIAPFPGAGNDRTLRMFAFVAVGNVYGQNEKVTFSD